MFAKRPPSEVECIREILLVDVIEMKIALRVMHSFAVRDIWRASCA
jgi:hypothetical protein